MIINGEGRDALQEAMEEDLRTLSERALRSLSADRVRFVDLLELRRDDVGRG